MLQSFRSAPVCLVITICWAVLLRSPLGAATATCFALPDGTSCTGALGNSEDFIKLPFTVAGSVPATVSIQTYGFGGGISGAGTAIPAGGFDALVAIFSSAPEIVVQGAFSNPVASVPGSTQYFQGCPPAGLRAAGSELVCGDSQLSATLLPGTYELVLSDANYIPFAVSPGPPVSTALADGFADLTSGVFDTCTSNGNCLSNTADFAVDIRVGTASAAPEPSTLASTVLAAIALMFGFLWTRILNKKRIEYR